MGDQEVRRLLGCGNSEFYESNSNIYGRNCASSEDAMAASYTEIAMQPHSSTKRIKNAVNDYDSLHCSEYPYGDVIKDECDISEPSEDNELQNKVGKKYPERPASLLCDKTFSYDLDGTVHRDGEMTHFVAENLEYKIKLSSPITKRDLNQQNTSSKSSTPSTSTGLLPRHFFQSQLAQIDSNVLSDIEIDAQYLAASVDNLTENLYNLLHSVSSITADNVEIHKNSVNKLTDNMDANIKCMYTIMAKTEEISKSMKPTEQMALRIREIKRLVEMLESNV